MQFIRSKSPDNKDYSPIPIRFFTFERYKKEKTEENLKKKVASGIPQHSYISSDKRFRYPEEKKGFDAGPGPNCYEIGINWLEKVENQKKMKKKMKN